MKAFVKLIMLACLAAAYVAPAASAAVVTEATKVCTMDRKFQITFGPAGPERASATWSNVVCHTRDNRLDLSNLDVRSTPNSVFYSGSVQEFALTGAASALGFTAVGTASEPGSGWEGQLALTASGDSITGSTVETVTHENGTRAVINSVISPAGTCGTGCYLATARSVQNWVRYY